MITVRTRNGKETFFEGDTWAYDNAVGLTVYAAGKIIASFPNGEWYGVDNVGVWNKETKIRIDCFDPTPNNNVWYRRFFN